VDIGRGEFWLYHTALLINLSPFNSTNILYPIKEYQHRQEKLDFEAKREFLAVGACFAAQTLLQINATNFSGS
jgi:hypothetical protein